MRLKRQIDVIRSEGNDNIIIHQCPSGYPARLDSINLNVIPTLKRLFPYPVAFSDHTPGATMDIAAVVLGANLVEKTITEDRTTRSVEHIMSIEPDEMKQFIQTIHEVKVAMGSPQRILHPEEKKQRMALRRSVFLRADVKRGTRLKDCDVEFCRPGFGLSPDRYEDLLETVFIKDMPAGKCIEAKDLIWESE